MVDGATRGRENGWQGSVDTRKVRRHQQGEGSDEGFPWDLRCDDKEREVVVL